MATAGSMRNARLACHACRNAARQLLCVWIEHSSKLQHQRINPHLHASLFRREASMMAALRHPNVVAFLGVCATPPCVATGALDCLD